MLTSDWFDSDFQVKLENDVNILRLTPFYQYDSAFKRNEILFGDPDIYCRAVADVVFE